MSLTVDIKERSPLHFLKYVKKMVTAPKRKKLKIQNFIFLPK